MVRWAGLDVQLFPRVELRCMSVFWVRVDCLFSLEIKMSEVIAFKMPSPDENPSVSPDGECVCVGPLLAGAYSLHECPSNATQGSSAESPLMVKIKGCKLSNCAISSFFLKGRTASSHNLPMTDLTMTTEVNEWHDCPLGKPMPSNCKTICWQLPEKGQCDPCKSLLLRWEY